MTPIVKGLLVHVQWFENGKTDCSLNGVTNPVNCPKAQAILIWDGTDSRTGLSSAVDAAVFLPCDGVPVLKVENFHGRLRAVPCFDDGTKRPGWFMFSGNFVYTSDSRFPNDYPIPVHDRQE